MSDISQSQNMGTTAWGGPKSSTPRNPRVSRTAPRKLLVKQITKPVRPNLCRGDMAERFYLDIESKLKNCVYAILHDLPISDSLEELYRGTENLCRHDKSSQVWKMILQSLKDRIEELKHIIISSLNSVDPVPALQTVLKVWEKWSIQIKLIRNTFLYLDRSYLLNSTRRKPIWTTSTELFFNVIIKNEIILPCIINGFRVLFNEKIREREEAIIEDSLLSIFDFYRSFGNLSASLFEPYLIDHCREYYKKLAENLIPILKIDIYAKRVHEDCAKESDLSLHLQSELLKVEMQRIIYEEMVIKTTKRLLDLWLEELLEKQDAENLQLLETLIVDEAHKIKTDYLQAKLKVEEDPETKEDIFGDLSPDYLDKCKRDRLLYLRESFKSYIIKNMELILVDMNDKYFQTIKNLIDFRTRWKNAARLMTNYSSLVHDERDLLTRLLFDFGDVTATRLSKFIGDLLKSGFKDYDDPEIMIKRCVDLFRLIDNKTYFESLYRREFGRRLLLNKVVHFEQEEMIITQLREECGSHFTEKMEGMFKDKTTNNKWSKDYRMTDVGKEKLLAVNGPNVKCMEFNVDILTESNWPNYPSPKFSLPPCMDDVLESFTSFYKENQSKKNQSKLLTWNYMTSHCTIKANFPKGAKIISLNLAQTAVILLFNGLKDDDETLTYSHIQESLGDMDEHELKQVLYSLTSGKVKVLKVIPEFSDISKFNSCHFAVNLNFESRNYKLRVNYTKLVSKEDSEDSKRDVKFERGMEVKAAIIRIMKVRKNLSHEDLITEVSRQCKGRGIIPIKEVKIEIEDLLSREFIRRIGNDDYAYIA